MYDHLIRDARFFRALLKFDEDLAEKAGQERCRRCGGRLDRSPYPRKPRGCPDEVRENFQWRHSFCCATLDCRTRMTPPSVRYQGRRFYVGGLLLLVPIMVGEITPKRAAEMKQLVGVSTRTLHRWREWWQEIFVQTPFWKAGQGRFASLPDRRELPASLLARFRGDDEKERVLRALDFLSPLSTRSSSTMAA